MGSKNWRHQAITWTYVYLSSMRSFDIHLKAALDNIHVNVYINSNAYLWIILSHVTSSLIGWAHTQNDPCLLSCWFYEISTCICLYHPSPLEYHRWYPFRPVGAFARTHLFYIGNIMAADVLADVLTKFTWILSRVPHVYGDRRNPMTHCLPFLSGNFTH